MRGLLYFLRLHGQTLIRVYVYLHQYVEKSIHFKIHFSLTNRQAMLHLNASCIVDYSNDAKRMINLC